MQALFALLIATGHVVMLGPLSGREIVTRRAGVTRAELSAAGALELTWRQGLCLYNTPDHGRATRREPVALLGQNHVFLPMARGPLMAGYTLVGCRATATVADMDDSGVEVAHECRCSSGSSCTALDPEDGVRRALPLWTIAGPDYQWTAPAGTGCRAVACNESVAGREWNAECPR